MKAFLYFLICFSFAIANAQIQYKFNHFTTDQGLPSNTIYSITEDKKDNIVLGTDNGLTFFDGNDFTNFNVKDGLINPYITTVSIDVKGVIWFINYNGKLQKFEKNKIINTPIFTETYNQLFNLKDKLFLYTIQNRFIDKRYCYKEINKNNWQIKKQKKPTDSQRIAPPILFQDNQEIKFKNNNLVYNNYRIPLSDEVKFLHKVIFRKKDVCILDENFLFFVNFEGKILNKIKLPQSLSLKPVFKYDFIVDNQENCWLSIQGKGLFILKNNNWSLISENLGLNSSDNINYLFCDKKGRIWIATNENGLFCIPSTFNSSIQFENQENYFNGFANSLDEKSMFVATKFSFYCYQNKELKLIKKSDLEIKIDNFNNFPVFYVPINAKISWNKTTNLQTVSGKQIIKKDNNKYYILAGNSSINVFENDKINYKSIISKIPKKEKIKQVVFYKNEYYFNNAEKINIRTFDDQFIYNKRDLKFKIKGYIEDFSFLKDTMWIAANNSIYKVFNEKIVDSISQINETKIDNIHKIKQINDIVFLCAGNGLFMVSKNGNRVLNKHNYLPNNDVYNVAVFDKELLVATKDGLAKLDFDLLSKKTEKPKTSFFYDDLKTQKIKQIDKKINIEVRQKSIQIFLEIQNFNSIKNQLIQYKIDDSNWTILENKTIDFETVSFGEHKIQVRVKDINSDWDNQSLIVYREFPFFLKWWFLLLFGLLIWSIYKIIDENLEKQKAIKQQIKFDRKNRIIELRQNALSAMMNPHFVFNSLNAIQYFVNSNQKEQSSEHLAKLARLVRLFLSQASEPFISLADEIKRLKLYLELEQVRFMNFEFSFNINEKIDIHQTKIPNMIVQPFIENAILHGVSHLKHNDGKISLNFSLNLDVLTIEIIDNGFGININQPKNDSHISKGIAIITERIEILQESYPEKIFSITQENAFPDAIHKGYKVVIVVTILD